MNVDPQPRNKSRNIGKVTLFVVPLLLLVVAGVSLGRYIKSSKDQTPEQETTKVEIVSNETKSTQQTLNIMLAVKNSTTRPFELRSINQYNNQPDAPVGEDMQYKLTLIENMNEVYRTNFMIPMKLAESIDPQTKQIIALEVATVESLSFNVPRVKDGATIKVLDKNGNTVFIDTVKNVQVHDNEATYQTIKGEDVPIN